MIVLSDDYSEIGIFPGRCIEMKNLKNKTKRRINWSEVKQSGIFNYLTEKLLSRLTYELNGYAASFVNFDKMVEEFSPSTKVKNEPITPEIVFEEITPKLYLKSSEVSSMYGISEQTLANWRYERVGPKYYKFGRSIRYKVEELDKFM